MKRLFSLALAMVFIFAGIATVSAYTDITPEDAYEMVADPVGLPIPGTDPQEYYPEGTVAYILDVRTPAEWYWVGHPGMEVCKGECVVKTCQPCGDCETCLPPAVNCETVCPCPGPGPHEACEYNLECRVVEGDPSKCEWYCAWRKYRGGFLEGNVINIPWHLWEYIPQEEKYDSKIPNRFFDEEVVRQFDPGDIIIIMCRSGSRSVSGSEELEEPSHPAFKRLEELGYYNVYNMLGGFEGGKDSCGYRTKNNGWKKIEEGTLPYNYSDTGIWTPDQKGRKLHK